MYTNYLGVYDYPLQTAKRFDVCIYQAPPHREDVIQAQFFSGVSQVWILFCFSLTSCPTKVKDPSLPFY